MEGILAPGVVRKGNDGLKKIYSEFSGMGSLSKIDLKLIELEDW
ncbi:MAG: hypothetical protein ACTSPD_09605 [Promethearchaeota archaeon]